MDLQTWWKRFELFVRSAKIEYGNLRNVLMSCLDDEYMTIFENCTPQLPFTVKELGEQIVVD